LRHSLEQPHAANALEAAVSAVIADGWRTADIHEPGGRLIGCQEMGARVRGELERMLS
jgi:3-isopropylmalate dehydrogenase